MISQKICLSLSPFSQTKLYLIIFTYPCLLLSHSVYVVCGHYNNCVDLYFLFSFPNKNHFRVFQSNLSENLCRWRWKKNRKKIKTWKIHLSKKIVYLFWDWFCLLNKQGMKPRRFKFMCGESLNPFKANRNSNELNQVVNITISEKYLFLLTL